MGITAKRIYCFIEKYESETTTALSATISLWLIRIYFKNQDTKDFGQLTEEEKKKLKKSNKRISRALKLSKSNEALKLRGGGIDPMMTKLIATRVARITVTAAKDGSIHALALLIACKVHPASEKFVKAICLGGNTDALVNEIANNLHTKRQTVLRRIIMNKKIRENINTILLELELIKKPLTQLELLRVSAVSLTAFDIPIVQGTVIAARGITLMFITGKIRQLIVSELSGEIARGVLTVIIAMLSSNPENAGAICGFDLTEIQRFKEGLASRSTLGQIGAAKVSGANNIITPTFNDDIIDFIDMDPVVERLTGSRLLDNSLIPYTPKFNVDYVIERLVIGNDISKLPIDHITNLW